MHKNEVDPILLRFMEVVLWKPNVLRKVNPKDCTMSLFEGRRHLSDLRHSPVQLPPALCHKGVPWSGSYGSPSGHGADKRGRLWLFFWLSPYYMLLINKKHLPRTSFTSVECHITQDNEWFFFFSKHIRKPFIDAQIYLSTKSEPIRSPNSNPFKIGLIPHALSPPLLLIVNLQPLLLHGL